VNQPVAQTRRPVNCPTCRHLLWIELAPCVCGEIVQEIRCHSCRNTLSIQRGQRIQITQFARAN